MVLSFLVVLLLRYQGVSKRIDFAMVGARSTFTIIEKPQYKYVLEMTWNDLVCLKVSAINKGSKVVHLVEFEQYPKMTKQE